MRFNPPPNWPPPPPDWTPPPHWRPDPAWSPPPAGWQLWLPDGPGRPGHQVAPLPYVPVAPARPSRAMGWLMVALPTLTCTLAGFVPPLWAATQRRDRAFRRRMYLASAGILATLVTGLVLVDAAPEDVVGDPTGPLSGFGAGLMALSWLVATVVAVLVRGAGAHAALPGVAQELARRQLREDYRRLAATDPAVALSIGVGRPDLPRSFDDGGLLDLNSAPAGALSEVLPSEEAERVVAARAHLGRFAGLAEVAVYADLPEVSMARLEERAVFL